MRLFPALLGFILLGAGGASAQNAGHCMATTSGTGCETGAVTDADGILLPGFHAYFGDPTDRYDHGVLGDAIEWGSLTFLLQGSTGHGPYVMETITLPKTRVFEDLAPRLVDLDGDGTPEVIVVETQVNRGAQLAVYGLTGNAIFKKLSATPHLGRSQRWLAPAGIGDLDGDGTIEIAYVEKPHLTKILKIWRWQSGRLKFVAQRAGLTNHQIGQDFITGGLRDCGQGPEIITVNGDWSRVVATRLDGDVLTSRVIGAFTDAGSVKAALACES